MLLDLNLRIQGHLQAYTSETALILMELLRMQYAFSFDHEFRSFILNFTVISTPFIYNNILHVNVWYFHLCYD